MNGTRSSRRICAWIFLAFCSLPLVVRAEQPADSALATTETPPAGVHRLTSVQATRDDTGVRVFLGADGPIEAHSFLLVSPDRLVVDLEGVETVVKTNRIQVDSVAVSRVRIGQHTEGVIPVARVVLDLNGPQPYDVAQVPGGLVVHVGGSATEAAADFPVRDAAVPVEADPAVQAPAAVPQEVPEPAAGHQPTEALEGAEAQPLPALAPLEREIVQSPADPQVAPAAGAVGEPLQAAQRAAVPPTSMFAAGDPPSHSTPAETWPRPETPQGATYETKKITDATNNFTGKKISLNLVDADVKQIFRLFHEISGLNFVLDPGVAGNVTIVLDEVPWDQALDIILKNNGLDKVYEANVIRIASTQKLASEAGGRKALKEAKELEVEPVTITRRLSYAKSREVDQIIRTGVLLSSRGKSFFDERTNTLIVTDIPAKIEPLNRLVTALDEKTPQVMIEARIVLTARDFLQDLGINWGFTVDKNRPPADIPGTGPNFPNRGDVTYKLFLPRVPAANRLAFNLFNHSGTFNLNVALDALETDGRARTISAPKIATQNNVKAEIEQGVQIPYSSSTATEVNVQFIAASLRLSVTPQITAEGTVIMDITVENNQPSKTVQVGQIPGIDTQRAQTKVMVDDGGTTVIGGIFSVTEATSESGVPWFRKIPVFGWLFKSRNISTQNRELLIFITPKILRAV